MVEWFYQAGEGPLAQKIGQAMNYTETVIKQSRDDESFGIFKRPTKAGISA